MKLGKISAIKFHQKNYLSKFLKFLESFKTNAKIVKVVLALPLFGNKLDPVTVSGVKGSLGLFQINLFWISKTSSYPKGFLQTVLKRDLVPTDLFVPEINVAAAEAIIKYNRGNGGCGWSAWNGC